MDLGVPLWNVVMCTISGCGKEHPRELCGAAPLQEVPKFTVAGCYKIAVHHVAGMCLGDALWDGVKCTVSGNRKASRLQLRSAAPLQDVPYHTAAQCHEIAVLHVADMCLGDPLWDGV